MAGKPPSNKRTKKISDAQKAAASISINVVTDDPFEQEEAKPSDIKNDNDNDIAAKNRKKYGQQISDLETFKKNIADLFQMYVNLPFDIDFQAGKKQTDNDLYHSVLLGKQITSTGMEIKRTVVNDEDKDIKIVINNFDHIKVGYYQIPQNEYKVEVIKAGGLLNNPDLSKKSRYDSEATIDEMVKAAFLMAAHAKALGWTEVNFGNTQDPVKRYILQQVCQHESIGLDCSSERDHVKIAELPVNDNIKDKKTGNVIPMDLIIKGRIKEYSENILMEVQVPDTQPTPAPQLNAA